MRYANFNDQDDFVNLLIKGVHDIPEGAIPVNNDMAVRLMDERDGVWRRENGTIVKGLLPEPEPYIPQSVTMRQARLALLGAGMLSQVEATIAALPEPDRTAATIEWEYSQEVQRHNGFVAMLGPMLGLDDAQLDALFVQAATL